MARFPLNEWQAAQARFTVFAMSEAPINPQQWWQELVGSEPDDVNLSPKKHSGSIQGTYGPGILALRTEPARIDWLLQPSQAVFEKFIAESEHPSLGTATAALETFSELVKRWLAREDLPVVGRIAFGAALIHPEVDGKAVYDRLPDYVPVQLPPGSSDFLFQINRPQPSATTIDGLTINRLSIWNVIQLKITRVASVFDLDAFNLRLELDINTAPAFPRPIPRERLAELYDELLSEGMRIAASGVPTL